MRNWQQLIRGILVALAAIGFVLGGFSLSLAEGDVNLPAPSATLPPPATSTDTPPAPLTPPAESPTPLPPTLTWTATWTVTLPPPPTNCPPPAGWVPYIVQPGDTLEALATSSHISTAELSQANCLLTSSLLPGVVLYMPPVPTQTPIPCGPPAGWVIYIVRPGDTLYHLSQAYGVSVAELQRANCMGQSTLLHTGQKLYVPPGPTRTSTLTPTRSATLTPTRSPTRSTLSPSPATGTASPSTSSPTPSFTPTPTYTPTSSLSPRATETPTPTNTATATSTPTATDTP
jgi:LysM repeat protein